MSVNTTSIKPAYYVYPGLRAVTVPTLSSHYSPEERLDFIMLAVRMEFAKRFEFDTERMMSNTREMPYALARMTYYYYARVQCPTLTLREIARSFSDLRQHHTTLLHACQAVQNIIDTQDRHYYDVVTAIGERLQ